MCTQRRSSFGGLSMSYYSREVVVLPITCIETFTPLHAHKDILVNGNNCEIVVQL